MAPTSTRGPGGWKRGVLGLALAVGLAVLGTSPCATTPTAPALRLEVQLLDDGVLRPSGPIRVRVTLRNTGDAAIRVPPLTLPGDQLCLRVDTPAEWAAGRQGIAYPGRCADARDAPAQAPGDDAKPNRVTLDAGAVQAVTFDLLELGPPPPSGRWRLTAVWSWRGRERRADTGLEVYRAREQGDR